MTNIYTVSPRSEANFEPFTVKASDYNEAAAKVAKKLYRAKNALRVSGTIGFSGVFQGYNNVRGGGLTSTGGNFHLSEL